MQPMVQTKYFLKLCRLWFGTDCSRLRIIPAPSKQYTAAQKKKGKPSSDTCNKSFCVYYPKAW